MLWLATIAGGYCFSCYFNYLRNSVDYYKSMAESNADSVTKLIEMSNNGIFMVSKTTEFANSPETS